MSINHPNNPPNTALRSHTTATQKLSFFVPFLRAFFYAAFFRLPGVVLGAQVHYLHTRLYSMRSPLAAHVTGEVVDVQGPRIALVRTLLRDGAEPRAALRWTPEELNARWSEL